MAQLASRKEAPEWTQARRPQLRQRTTPTRTAETVEVGNQYSISLESLQKPRSFVAQGTVRLHIHDNCCSVNRCQTGLRTEITPSSTVGTANQTRASGDGLLDTFVSGQHTWRK